MGDQKSTDEKPKGEAPAVEVNPTQGEQDKLTDIDQLLTKLKTFEKDNYELRERERKRKAAEDEANQKRLIEEGKLKEAYEELVKKSSTAINELDEYKNKVTKYEESVKSLAESQFKKLTPEQQKKFAVLFGEELDPATKLEKIDKFITVLPTASTPSASSPAKQGSKSALEELISEAQKDKSKRQELSQDLTMRELIKQTLL